MLKDKNGKEVKKFDWLQDVNGIYEVTRLNVGAGNFTELAEVMFGDTDDEYVINIFDKRYLTDLEIGKMERM